MSLYEAIKNNLVESDSSFDVEGLADRIDILMSNMDPYEHMDVYGSYDPTEESYQATLDSLYNNPQSVLDSISSYDIIDWEDDIQTEYNEVIQDLKEWIGLSKKNEAEEPGEKGYWVKIKMKNNKQVLHLFNTEDEMREYLNLLSHYVGQGEVEILDYTGKDSKKNEADVKLTNDFNLVDNVESYIDSSTPKFVVYTTTEIAPGEYKTDVYGEYYSSEQASDVCRELRSTGVGASIVVESDNSSVSIQDKNSWLTSKDIDWLSTQGHLPNLNKLSMNYKATGDIETDECELDDIASNYFYDDVGIYNENIDSLCTKWAHDQAVKINKAMNESDKSADFIPNYDGVKCPKCGSNEYYEVDDEEYSDGTQVYHLECNSCGYVSDKSEFNHEDYNESDTSIDEHLLDLVNQKKALLSDDSLDDDKAYELIEKIDNEMVNAYPIDEIERAEKQVGLSESEDDEYENPKYKVEIRDLHLTNHGYHNNSDIAWGRVKLIPKDGSGIDDSQFGLWDVIYFRESDPLFCFKIGYPVKAVANALYDYSTDEGNYTVRINSEDIPVDDLWEKINRDCTKLSVDAEGAIEGAIERAIRDDSIDKVDYQ